MFAALLVLHVLVSISLVLTVLLQTGRGADLGAAFGSVGQATFGRGPTTFVAKFTRVLAVVFMCTSLSLAFLSVEKRTSSVIEVQSPTAAEQSAPPTKPPAGAGSVGDAPAGNRPQAAQPPAPVNPTPPGR